MKVDGVMKRNRRLEREIKPETERMRVGSAMKKRHQNEANVLGNL